VVDGLNAYVGPELASMPGVLLSFLPAESIDMDKPMAWAVLGVPGQGEPMAVIMARLKDGATIPGPADPDGIIQLPPAGPPIPLFAMKAGNWVLFGLPPHLKAFKAKMAGPAVEVTEMMAAHMTEDLAWVHLNIKPLAATAKPMIEHEKTMAARRAAGGGAPVAVSLPPAGVASGTAAAPVATAAGTAISDEVKVLDWAANLVGQFDSLELGLMMDGSHCVLRVHLAIDEKGEILAMARTLQPIESYEGMLPETDRFLAAAWVRADRAKGAAELKTFLKPVMDFAFEKLGEAAKAQAGANPMEALTKSIDALWQLLDQYPDAMGDRSAMLAEIGEPGQGAVRSIAVQTLKDSAKYNAMKEKSLSVVDGFLKAISGELAAVGGPQAPKMIMGMDFKAGAEKIDGTDVDVMKFNYDMKMPKDAAAGMPFNPEEFMKSYQTALYGPDGLITRMAVVKDLAISAMGGKDVMERAIKHAKGQGGDLAKQKAVAEAIARVPAKSSIVAMFSCPAYLYTIGQVVDPVMAGMLPPERRKAMDAVPMPKIERPALGAPTIVSVQVVDRTITLQIDMPQSELGRSLTYGRSSLAKILVDGLNFAMMMKMSPGMSPGMPPHDMSAPMPPGQLGKVNFEKSQIATISHQLEMYNLNIGHYPTDDEGGLSALLVQPNFADKKQADNWAGPYINLDQLKDPWGSAIHYQLTAPGANNELPFKLWSSGPDGMDGTADDIKNWSDAAVDGPPASPPAKMPATKQSRPMMPAVPPVGT
jgi:general secretion pathway protein G